MDAKSRRKGSIAYAHAQKPLLRSRRGPLLIFGAAAIIFFTIFFSTSSVTELSNNIHEFHFSRPSAHHPPVQKNSSSGDASWYNDWKWLHPFSSSITFDDNRSVLPPPSPRPTIYTYYHSDLPKDDAGRAAENKLLLIWRRAWWAKGFRPVVLGKAEAMSNPWYEKLQGKKLQPAVSNELMRWMAWSHMGTGLLANWLLLPMGPYDDVLLSSLRRGEFPKLYRYEGLNTGLFSASKEEIESTLKAILDAPDLETAKNFLDIEVTRDPKIFSVDLPSSLAFYETAVLSSTYKVIADMIVSSPTTGLSQLALLMTSHLHTTFLNQYPSGIAVLVPHPLLTTYTAMQPLALANALTTCPPTPLPESCPPNKRTCTPCASRQISFPTSYPNDTQMFTINSQPHPYTLATLFAKSSDITVRHVRRETARDPWLQAVTAKTLGPKISSYARISPFKDIVASPLSFHHGLWHTAERQWTWKDLEWHLGFSIPGANTSLIEFQEPTLTQLPPLLVPLLEMLDKPPSRKALVVQKSLLEKGRAVVRGRRVRKSKASNGPTDMREVVEAWHLADVEAWRFVRAFEARSRVEREAWEEEERGFAGLDGEVSGRGEGWGVGRWFDRVSRRREEEDDD